MALDFRTLDTITEKTVKQQGVAGTDTQVLMQVLDKAAGTMRSARSEKRDADISAEQQSQKILQESTKLAGQAVEAAGNPFYGVISLFTDDPSLDEIEANHNLLQHRLRLVQQSNASAVSKFNFTATEVQADLGILRAKRKLGQETIAQLGQTAAAIATQQGARSTAIEQQLDELDLGELKQELKTREIGLPKARVAARISEIENRDKVTDDTIQDARKARLKNLKLEREVVDKFLQSGISDTDLLTAVNAGKGGSFTSENIFISQSKLLEEQNRREGVQQEEFTRLTKFAEELNKGRLSALRTGDIVTRAMGFDSTPFVLGADGQPVFDITKAPLEVAEDMQTIQNLELIAQNQENIAQETGDPTALQRALILRNQQNKLSKEINKKVVAKAQEPFVSKEAKAGVKEFIEDGRLSSTQTATALGIEELATMLPTSITPETEGLGYSVALQILSDGYQRELQDALGGATNLDPDADESQVFQQLLNSVLTNKSSRITAEDAFRTALSQADIDEGSGRNFGNRVQNAATNEWAAAVLGSVVRQLIVDHEAEPQTANSFKALLNGMEEVKGEILQSPDMLQELYMRLAKSSLSLVATEALPEGTNLATELQTRLVDPALYQSDFVTNMTTPQTPLAAIIARTAFNNNQHGWFVNTMRQNAGLQDINQMIEVLKSNEAQAAEEEKFSRTFGTKGSGLPQERR